MDRNTSFIAGGVEALTAFKSDSVSTRHRRATYVTAEVHSCPPGKVLLRFFKVWNLRNKGLSSRQNKEILNMLRASVPYHEDFLTTEGMDPPDLDLCMNRHKWLASASVPFNLVKISTGIS